MAKLQMVLVLLIGVLIGWQLSKQIYSETFHSCYKAVKSNHLLLFERNEQIDKLNYELKTTRGRLISLNRALGLIDKDK